MYHLLGIDGANVLGDMLSLFFRYCVNTGGFAKTLAQSLMEFANLLLLVIELGVKAQQLLLPPGMLGSIAVYAIGQAAGERVAVALKLLVLFNSLACCCCCICSSLVISDLLV